MSQYNFNFKTDFDASIKFINHAKKRKKKLYEIFGLFVKAYSIEPDITIKQLELIVKNDLFAAEGLNKNKKVKG